MADLKVQGKFYSLQPEQVEGECTGCHLDSLVDENGEYECEKLNLGLDGGKVCDGQICKEVVNYAWYTRKN